MFIKWNEPDQKVTFVVYNSHRQPASVFSSWEKLLWQILHNKVTIFQAKQRIRIFCWTVSTSTIPIWSRVSKRKNRCGSTTTRPSRSTFSSRTTLSKPPPQGGRSRFRPRKFRFRLRAVSNSRWPWRRRNRRKWRTGLRSDAKDSSQGYHRLYSLSSISVVFQKIKNRGTEIRNFPKNLDPHFF